MSNLEILHVYVLEDENKIIKIGIASNVAKRMKAIENGSAYEITRHYESPSCVNAAQIERAAHKHFADRRKKGEWFIVPFEEVVDFVKGHFVETAQQLALPVEQPTEINRGFNGHTIKQRTVDGYFDATAMCQATGKLFKDYRRLQSTQEFLAALSDSEGFPIETAVGRNLPTEQNQGLIQITQGGNPQNQGTWVHPYISINLAQWCSPEFAVRVSKWTFELMTKGRVSLNGQSQQVSLTPEVEACIAARVQDVVTNTLATPIKLPDSNVAENEKAERLLNWLHGSTAAEHFKDGYINHTQIYMRGLRFARNPKNALKYMTVLEQRGQVFLVTRGRSRLWKLSDKAMVKGPRSG